MCLDLSDFLYFSKGFILDFAMTNGMVTSLESVFSIPLIFSVLNLLIVYLYFALGIVLRPFDEIGCYIIVCGVSKFFY
jgi:hypothetical protein